MGAGDKVLGHPLLLFPGHQQKAGLEMEQTELKTGTQFSIHVRCHVYDNFGFHIKVLVMSL